jgi:tetratricopeptide (TPR) repeat protein
MRKPLIITLFFLLMVPFSVQAQERTSDEIVRLAWAASTKDDLNTLTALVDEMLKNYEDRAKDLASQLNNFPPREKINDYKVMSDVATALFIKAETLMRHGKNAQSKEVFNKAIKEYPWAQTFDPSRGSYWSVKEKSQDSINVMNGIQPKEAPVVKFGPKTKPTLAFPGTEKVIDYSKYGQFLNIGTKSYHYLVTDRKGLSVASGEGIYPNIAAIYKDPEYKKALKEGRLKGNHWDFVNTPDLQAAFFKWATAPEPPGLSLFYIGLIFEKAKMYYEALKCYDAIIVHFPETIAWTYWHTPWYPSQAAIAKIQHILRMHPELNLELKGTKIQILNSFDNDPSNDVTITTPGILRELTIIERAQDVFHIERKKVLLGEPVKTLGQGYVHFAQYANGHWQMIVNNKPFIIKGITYSPTTVGQSPDNGTLTNWMEDNPNPAFTAWMDKNQNDKQDPDEPSEGDFSLMKKMGVNALRIYHHPMKLNKDLLKKMYDQYGFMVIMGDYVGKYAIGSGASWSEGTDYDNPEHQKKMMESVKEMVMEYKDQPFILMWLLGNENNYGVASNADKKPESYYKFTNEVAKMIKSIDPNHPVAVCNGDILFLDKFGKNAPDVDAYGANVYRGDYGFGSYWQQITEVTGKPAFVTEYGAPAYSGPGLTIEEALDAQADYHKGNWLDILYNSGAYEDGEGNAIGGIAFEWLDEWWKNYEPSIHDTKADVVGPFPGGYYYEEWFGILGQGKGKNSPFQREPRKVYYMYKDLWSKE